MDYTSFLIYSLIGIVIISLFFLVVLFGAIVLKIFKKDPEESYTYLKNIIYGAFGGLIAAIFLESKGDYSTSIFYWIPKILSTLLIILIFVILGFVYLYLLKIVYKRIILNNPKPLKKKMKEENVKKTTLEDFFRNHQYALIVLSIFLLVTIELVGKEGYLNNVLALLSSLITYSILIGIKAKDANKDTLSLVSFKIVFPIFISTFCAWVILNVVITLTGEVEKIVWIIVWLVLMVLPSFRFWIQK